MAEVVSSANSTDDQATVDDKELSTDAWKSDLADRIEQTIDRKRSSVQGREATLRAYIHVLANHYAEDEICGKKTELVTAFLKSIKAETSEKETILAMKGSARTDGSFEGADSFGRSASHDSHNLPFRSNI